MIVQFIVSLCLTGGSILLFGLAFPAITLANDIGRAEEEIEFRRPGPIRPPLPKPVGFAASSVETVWVGFQPTSLDPNKVGVGGVWDWDTDVSGTDSTQFWTFQQADWRSDVLYLPNPLDRPMWHIDHGNEINIGDTNLWAAREAGGRTYRRTGIVGAWHRDPMTNLPGSSGPIGGSASAWCGLRTAGDYTVRDELTGNPITGSLAKQWLFGSVGTMITGWPGYGDQWDQMLYRDVPGNSGALTFRLRTDLSEWVESENIGSGWFNPDPLYPDHYRHEAIDSFMVWIGVPQEAGVYDTNRRWLSEVIDFSAAGSAQPQKLFSVTGKLPRMAGPTDTTVTLPIPNLAPTVRIVFQVKTNRQGSDEYIPTFGFESSDGAAVIDDILVGSTSYDFEDPLSIRPRALINEDGTLAEIDPSTAWITTGKPPSVFGHIESIYDLPYEDVCGSLQSPIRWCNLADNVMLQSNHDDNDVHFEESWNWAVSPTIKPHPGNQQGIPSGMEAVVLDMDFYDGDMTNHAVVWQFAVRYMGANSTQEYGDPGSGWVGFTAPPYLIGSGSSHCFNPFEVYSDWIQSDLQLLTPLAEIDSFQIAIGVQTRCARLGAGMLCGNARGLYFDNVRVGFVTQAEEPMAGLGSYWDTFPFNESVSPGSADFDTTTALLKGGGFNAGGTRGVMTSDSLTILAQCDEGIRMDLLFRVLPGPGNYTIKGDRASPLIEKDQAHPFWSTYIEDNGTFGSPDGHGSNWDPNVWNSVRLDSSEQNLSTILQEGIGGPSTDLWMTTIHENDPKYDILGIEHNVCFTVDPGGVVNSYNICCSSAECSAAPFFDTWPPLAYPPDTPTTTKEGTKVFPDGYFSPGTHIEYFARRSLAANPQAGIILEPDTTTLSIWWGAELERWNHTDVLPDLWKDEAYPGGSGLACMLVMDGCYGQQPAILGALDSLGYGKNNGASVGWKRVKMDGQTDPNDPAGFVSPNLGQVGLSFDWMDWGVSPGCRLAKIDVSENTARIVDRQCKAGPTPEMLKYFYNTVLWFADRCGVPKDGEEFGAADDIDLLRNFLLTSDPGDERSLWINGPYVPNALDWGYSLEAQELIQVHMGSLYKALYLFHSGNRESPVVFDPVAPGFHPERLYGLHNWCGADYHVEMDVNTTQSGPMAAALYEDQTHRGNTGINPFGPYVASIYYPSNPIAGRHFSTVLDGFSYVSLGGNGPASDATDFGRISWMQDVLAVFDTCFPLGPVIAVGDVPGPGGSYLSSVRRLFPNPSPTGQATLQFTLAKSARVSARFYNIAGRLVHRLEIDGKEGINTVRWDGRTSSGVRATSGVYFCRLSAPGVEFANNSQRLVILGRAGR